MFSTTVLLGLITTIIFYVWFRKKNKTKKREEEEKKRRYRSFSSRFPPSQPALSPLQNQRLVATTGEGLYEGLDWLSSTFK